MLGDAANFCPLVVFVAGIRVVEFGSKHADAGAGWDESGARCQLQSLHRCHRLVPAAANAEKQQLLRGDRNLKWSALK